MSIICQFCEKEFKSYGGLHKHLKTHDMTQEEYYHNFYPRYDRLTKEIIPYKSRDYYFNQEFARQENKNTWCLLHKDRDEVKSFMLGELKKRINDKELEHVPSYLEMMNSELLHIDVYREVFGAFSNVCSQLGMKPIFGKGINFEQFKSKKPPENLHVFIDTREQKPLKFKNSSPLKLDFGDYGTGGDHYDKTFVDRKSLQDFRGTLSQGNLERFREELGRAKKFGCYVYILTECSMQDVWDSDENAHGATTSAYLFHNARVLQHEFKGHCQFLFSGGRRESEYLIPRLLLWGKKLWDVDLQYYLDKYRKT